MILKECPHYEDCLRMFHDNGFIKDYFRCDGCPTYKCYELGFMKGVREARPIGELMEFARWVAKEVLDNYFEESSGAFAEIACRKLVKLGLVEIKDNVYKMKGGEGDD